MAGSNEQSQPSRDPNSVPAREPPERLDQLFSEIGTVAVRLRNLSPKDPAAQDALPAGEMSVLLILQQMGPQTVPAVARARSTSRQNIQILINRLISEGAVETNNNPAHKRSPLVTITETGRNRLARSIESEARHLQDLARSFDQSEIDTALECLRKLRRLLGQETQSGLAVLKSDLEKNPAKPMEDAKGRLKRGSRPSSVVPGPKAALLTSNELPFNLL